MESLSIKGKVGAVVAGLALTGGFVAGIPQFAFAGELEQGTAAIAVEAEGALASAAGGSSLGSVSDGGAPAVDTAGSTTAQPGDSASADKKATVVEGGASNSTSEAAGDGAAEGVSAPKVEDADDKADASGTLDSSTEAAASAASKESAADLSVVAEKDGWHEDAGGTYYVRDGKRVSGWLVDSSFGGYGLQRYWLGADGYLSRGSLVDASQAGWWAYARPEGFVVRGRWQDAVTGFVYLANNDGKLEDPGWHVTSSYGQGIQRYYVEASSHACEPGYSDSGYAHYTTNEGYVLRGASRSGSKIYLADNDGCLARSGSSTSGWTVTSAYGQGLQRYWVEGHNGSDGGYARIGYSTDGYAHYTTSAGYVLRGAINDGGDLRYADNDGRLYGSRWLVTSAFGQGLQRYWMGSDFKATKDRAISASEAGWNAYATSDGYVLRGALRVGDRIYLGNNDGVLSSSGWAVTSQYGQGLQRYWVEDGGYSLIGYSNGGFAHYTLGTGYVLRGAYVDGNKVYLADNDGRLARDGSSAPGWVVTSAYGQGLQRYWVEGHSGTDGGYAAVGYSDAGYHHFTTSSGYVLRGATAEGGVKRYADNDGRINDGWLITNAFGQGLQRYWQQDGGVVTSRFVDAGNNYWAYATADGRILRGRAIVGGKVYLADNDGRLANRSDNKDGFIVTSDYGDGLQRYYLRRVEGTGYSYAATGFFQAGSDAAGKPYWYYGEDDKGYVVRGKLNKKEGILVANNDGLLIESRYGAGMQTVSGFDSTDQIYYLVDVDGHLYAKVGLVTLGDDHYYGVENAGYLLRGKLRHGGGMLLANSKGVLAWTEGWLVTGEYDNGSVQRYRIDGAPGDGLMGARVGFFKLGEDEYYGRDDQGYVVRGTWVAPNGQVYEADNDGKIIQYWSKALARFMNYSSGTQYMLVVDTAHYRTFVFQGRAGSWNLLYDWLCGVGMPGHETEKGDYTIGGDGACYNWTRYHDGRNNFKGGYRTTYYPEDDLKYFTGYCLDIGFHSCIGWEGGYSDWSQLGKGVSHGCIRLIESNAKWIYDNALPGTRVITI